MLSSVSTRCCGTTKTKSRDRLTVAVGRSGRGKPDGNTTDLGRSSDTPKWVGRRPLGQKVWVLVQVHTGHTSSDVARRDAVDSNVVRSPLGSQVTCHLENGRLGGVVCNPVVVSVDNRSGHRGNEDDGAVNVRLLVHLASSGSGCQEDTSGVDVKDLLEGLDGVVESVVGLSNTHKAKAKVRHLLRTEMLYPIEKYDSPAGYRRRRHRCPCVPSPLR